MKYIPLSKGKFAIVDDDDYHYLSRFNWSICNGHAVRQFGTAGKNCSMLYMEFLIKQKTANSRYFFKNKNPLDLRKDNLEIRSFPNDSIGQIKTKKNPLLNIKVFVGIREVSVGVLILVGDLKMRMVI